MTVRRMDNVGIVVESLDAAIEFFGELGLQLEGRAMIEGEWASCSRWTTSTIPSSGSAPMNTMSQLEIDEAEWGKPENWRAGMFYFSRRDSRPLFRSDARTWGSR